MSPTTSPDLARYAEVKGIFANLLLLDDGSYYGTDGSSRSISNEVDRTVLVHLRRKGRAVVVGGNTARNEGYRPSERFDTFVFTGDPDSLAAGLKPLHFDDANDLQVQLVEMLERYGQILIEAGPNLLRKLIATGEVNYLCLTVIGKPDCETVLLRSILDVNNAQLLSKETVDNTHLSVWRLI